MTWVQEPAYSAFESKHRVMYHSHLAGLGKYAEVYAAHHRYTVSS